MITTIITTYKRPELLKRAVKSVLQQTYSSFQVCVYDNASNDGTKEVMQKFVEEDSRVKYHCHEKNIGMMRNYEYALSHVQTPFFSFLSDDDYLLPWFFETALKQFEDFPDAAFSACGVLAVNDAGKVVVNPLSSWKKEGKYAVPNGALEMVRKKGTWPIPTGIIFQHKLVKDIVPDWSDDIRLMWDPDYLLQIAAQHPIAITKKPCAIFSVHPNAFSSSFYGEIGASAKGFEDYMRAVNKVLKRLMENSYLNSEVKKEVRGRFVKMLQKEISIYMCQYILQNKISEVQISASLLQNSFELGPRVSFLMQCSKLCEKIPLFKSIIYSLLLFTRTGLRALRWLKNQISSEKKAVKQGLAYEQWLTKEG